MTAFANHRRIRAAALLGGVALITGTVAGIATAAPTITSVESGHDRTIILCGAPGDGAPPAQVRFQRTVPAEPGERVQPALPVEQGIQDRAPVPGPPLDGAECTRIEPAGVVPAQPAVPGTPALVSPPHTR
ncbi:hypothetical protein [Nocardia mangyaensis]|uniref:hypothetical protein n=1 Tax=Nocardia mangyaensis TaxID=2213200 RepID=UPI002676A6F8|nr:hypothetical protein [Nocardia mangyaensis]MDO3649597.1 hypothetical protein [Nocardia mangyaensis]